MNDCERLNRVLAKLLLDYLNERAHLSLNSLSINMDVPEATLRRIVKCHNKRMPSNDNLVKILKYIFKCEDLLQLKEMCPPSLGQYLEVEFSLYQDNNLRYFEVSEILNDRVTYLCFKLAANTAGVKIEEVKRLFGMLGEKAIEKLCQLKIVSLQEGIAKTEDFTFRLPDQQFIQNFQTTAEFIKTNPLDRQTSNIYSNTSESLNEQGLKQIIKIQREANRKILKIINDKSMKGEIPVFCIQAIDSLN